MNQNEIEHDLRELGQDWQKQQKSLADEVLEQLENEMVSPTVRATLQKQESVLGTGWSRSTLAISLASIVGAVIALGVWNGPVSQGFVSAEMLQEAVSEAIEKVETVRMTVTHYNEQSGKKQGLSKSLLDRKRGFVRGSIVDGRWIIVDLDNGKFGWEIQPFPEGTGDSKAEATYLKTRSSINVADIDGIFGQAALPESDYERLEDEDITFNSKKYACYSMKNIAPFSDGPQRVWVFVDKHNLIYLSKTWKQKNDRWILLQDTKYEYNVRIDPKYFEPDFGEHAKVVDVEEEFNKIASLDDCLFSKEIAGLTYGIHRVTPVEQGGLALLVSLRETAPGSAAGLGSWMPCSEIYTNFQTNNVECYRLVNADASEGIKLQWILIMPKKKDTLNPCMEGTKIEFDDTIGVEYGDSRHLANERIHVEFEMPKISEPVSLKQAAALVYKEQKQLLHVPYKVLFTGIEIKNNTRYDQRGNIETVTLKEYQDSFVDCVAFWRGRETKAEIEHIDQQIRNGHVTISRYVPGINAHKMRSFGDKELARACERDELVAVYISGSSITDDGLNSLLPLQKLEELVVGETKISDTSIQTLIQLKTLKVLDVTDTRITSEGAKRLKAGLPKANITSSFSE